MKPQELFVFKYTVTLVISESMLSTSILSTLLPGLITVSGLEIFTEVVQPKRDRVMLVVQNTFADGKRAQFNRFFERFYRDDAARSNEGGYGIGLSVAESICKRYRGSIKASWKAGMVSFTCQLRSA